MTAVRRLIFVMSVLLAARVIGQTVPADRFVSTVNSYRVHVLDWGGPQSGKPTLILLHGIARHAHTFDHIAPELAAKYRVLAVDMRGHGDSSWSPDGDYDVEDYVLDLEKVVERLGLNTVSLLGNSTGGRVAQVFAGLHSERVEKLVVEDVGPERPRSIADAFARRVEQEKNGWASEDELVAQLVAQNRKTPEPLLRTYAHFGVKKLDDGRLVWKRDPNLVKGFVETDLWDRVRRSRRRRCTSSAARAALFRLRHNRSSKTLFPTFASSSCPGWDTIRTRKTPPGS